MPRVWKPWMLLLLNANMILPWLFMTRVEARVVFGVALVTGAIFILLTAYSGFSRLLGLAHLPWIPLIVYLSMRLAHVPPDTPYGWWLRAVIVLNAGSVLLDASNVVRYLAGDRDEMVSGLDYGAAEWRAVGRGQ